MKGNQGKFLALFQFPPYPHQSTPYQSIICLALIPLKVILEVELYNINEKVYIYNKAVEFRENPQCDTCALQLQEGSNPACFMENKSLEQAI